MNKSIAIFSLLLILVVGTSISAQSRAETDPLKIFDEHKRWYNGFTETWFQFFEIPEEEVRKSIEHWQRIATNKHASSRLYGTGGHTHGTFMRMSPEEGFVWLDVDMCQGGPMRIIRGTVQTTTDGFDLKPEIELGSGRPHHGHGEHSGSGKMIQLVAVDWKESTYLIEKEFLSNFADFSAGLGEFNSQVPFAMEDPFMSGYRLTETPELPELPRFPKGFERYLKQPIRGQITSIGKDRRVKAVDGESDDEMVTPLTVRIETGEKHLKVGYFLHLPKSDEWTDERFKIVSFKNRVALVHRTRSVPKRNCVVSPTSDCEPSPFTPLRLGLALSSLSN